MSYIALYRKYRPQNLTEVKGQTHIVTTLQNIVHDKKVSHAYLFAGPRGTGKTSVAKVFAKILNCQDLEANGTPCEQCQSCQAVNRHAALDIIEIDAASNNGVAEIRELRNNIKFAPTNAKYKIYIVDEVHMLSKGAFNALLKTLEEPPRHAIFILATTEPHKIPITILSRTQRFNFRQIAKSVIIKQLKIIFAKEHFTYDELALQTIATLAQGGLRDALSIADQASAYTNGKITFAALSEVFGLVAITQQIELLNFAYQGQTARLLQKQTKMVQEGVDIARLAHSLIDILKDYIIFCKTDHIAFMQMLSHAEFQQLKIDLEFAYQTLDILIKLISELNHSEYPQQNFELAVLNFIKLAPTPIAAAMPTMHDAPPTKRAEKSVLIQNEPKLETTVNQQRFTQVFVKDETNNRAPLQADEIDLDTIQATTQIISTALEEEAIMSDAIEDAILSTQEISLNALDNHEEDQLVDLAFENQTQQASAAVTSPNASNLKVQPAPLANPAKGAKLEPIKTALPKANHAIAPFNDATPPKVTAQIRITQPRPTAPSQTAPAQIRITQPRPTVPNPTATLVQTSPTAPSPTATLVQTSPTAPSPTAPLVQAPPGRAAASARSPETADQAPAPMREGLSIETLVVPQSDLTTINLANLINMLVQTSKPRHAAVKAAWVKLVSYLTHEKFANFATFLEATSLIATGDNFIIITAQNAQICQVINSYQTDATFLKFITLMFGQPLWVFAIDFSLFATVKTAFLVQQKNQQLPSGQQLPSLVFKHKAQAITQFGQSLFGDLFK